MARWGVSSGGAGRSRVGPRPAVVRSSRGGRRMPRCNNDEGNASDGRQGAPKKTEDDLREHRPRGAANDEDAPISYFLCMRQGQTTVQGRKRDMMCHGLALHFMRVNEAEELVCYGLAAYGKGFGKRVGYTDFLTLHSLDDSP